MLKTKMIRTIYVTLSLLLGIVVVYGLTLAGDQTKGPVENLIEKASDVVNHVEKDIILKERQETRSSKLEWLQAYKADKKKILNPPQVLFGAYDNNAVKNFQPLIDLEDTLHTKFAFIHIYTAWGSGKKNEFPKEKVESINELGSIPVITWEPWLSAFDEKENPALRIPTERDNAGLKDIANGLYDAYVTRWAKAASKVKGPIVVRWAHEMNDPYRYPWGPQHNESKDFVAAYQRVHKLFRQAKANNVLWAWSPHPAYGFFKDYYPGDSLVDFVAVGTLNYGTVANWSKWWPFKDIFGQYYKALADFKKPIMLSEFGTLSVGGNRSAWFADALQDIPSKYPQVKAVLFFHYDDDRTTTQQSLNWYFINDKKVVRVIKPQIVRLQGETPVAP